MTVRNIAVSGMSGGAGHVGMVTQGFGGIYIAPVRIIRRVIKLKMARKE